MGGSGDSSGSGYQNEEEDVGEIGRVNFCC